MERTRELLSFQSARGRLPESIDEVPAWLAQLGKLVPVVQLSLPLPAQARESTAAALGKLGIDSTPIESGLSITFPADGDALDRCLALAGLARLRDPAGLLLARLSANPTAAELLPALSLPSALSPSDAQAYGCSSDPLALSVLVTNARIREGDLKLERIGKGPVVAVCAEYGRTLTSLCPPLLSPATLEESRGGGVPALRLHGFFGANVELERLPQGACATREREGAVARAETWLRELDQAWGGAVRSVVEVAWPAYRMGKGQGLLDATGQSMLPPLPA